jgi:hypothetical protein
MAKGRPAKIGAKADDRPQRALAIPGNSSLAIPPMPPTLPHEAYETWAIVCRSLPGLAESDLGDVEICVSSLHRFRQLDLQIQQIGYVLWAPMVYADGAPVLGEDGEPVMTATVPAAVLRLDKMRQAAANQYRYHSDQLGLSRMARARLGLIQIAGLSLAQAIDARL